MKKCLLIINPVAGRNQAQTQLFKMVKVLSNHDYEVTVYPTKGNRDCEIKVMNSACQYDLVCCCGGDGTLNEMVSGMMKSPEKKPMGYIPLGSTNDFAESLHIPNNVEQATTRIVEGNEFHMDVGSLNEHYFNYVAAFGAFTRASYATPQQAKNALGHMAYILEGAKSLSSLKPTHMKVITEQDTFEEDYLFGAVINTISLGGVLKLDPHKVQLDDGLFEVLLVKNPQNPLEAQSMLGAIMVKNYDGPLVKMIKAARIQFESDQEVSWTIDGEFGGNSCQTTVINNKNAVTIMV